MRGMIFVVGVLLLGCSISFSQTDHLSPAGTGVNGSLGGQRSLKIVTINVWSGLDYHGSFKFGEYEFPDRRELRFKILVQQLRALNPDVVFVQEANPVHEFSSRLADSLGFDEIHQVCNAGIKMLGLGLPSNFEEGIAILARKEFHLEEQDVWKLSGSFGIFGDFMSVNFDEAEFAQAGTITVNESTFFLINVHLSAFPPDDPGIMDEALKWFSSGKISQDGLEEVKENLSYGSSRRLNEVKELLRRISGLPKSVPIILGGDFNSESTSAELSRIEGDGGFNSVLPDSFDNPRQTWDARCNSNIKYSTQLVDARGEELDLAEKLSATYDGKPRTIDYIFVNNQISASDVRHAEVVLDSAYNGVFTSDHFGVMAEIDLSRQLSANRSSNKDVMVKGRASIEPLPIISYDTDTRFGYGAKIFLFDLMKQEESFDLVFFNSTKGERWYRAVLSYPDFESRQGTVYPVAADLTFDYDKWIKNNFFGVGNNSLISNHELYTREPMELDLEVSRGFSSQFVGQAIVKHESIRNFNFESDSGLAILSPSLNSETARYTSIGVTLRFDTRNSFINPSRGIVLQGESEYSPSWSLGNVSFGRLAGWFQYYSVLFYPTTVFALRVGVQQIIGQNLPVQVLNSIGGTNTLRGYPQDRYLDKACAILNAELRFPIFRRLGGVVGVDGGKVWQSLDELDIPRWAVNSVAGLRLYMDNFVVRADLGFGKDGTGFYLNFGQLF